MSRVLLDTRIDRIMHLRRLGSNNGYNVEHIGRDYKIFKPVDEEGKTRINVVYLPDSGTYDRMTVSISEEDSLDNTSEGSEIFVTKEFDSREVSSYKKVLNLAESVLKVFKET